MTTYLRNPLTDRVGAARGHLVSWLTARDGGAAHHLNVTVTVVVLVIAALKTQLVIWHFMEVRRAPVWLKATTTGWLVGVLGLLLGFYFVSQ